MPAKTSKKTARPKKPVARKPARPAPPVGHAVIGAPDDAKARVLELQAELEASRAEAHKLRESAGRTRGNGEPGKLRCPRCGASMVEHQQDSIFGRR